MKNLRKYFIRLCIATGLILPPLLLGGVYSHIGTNLIIISLISLYGIICSSNYLIYGKELNISFTVLPLMLVGIFILFQLIPLPPSILDLLSHKASYFNNIESTGAHPITLSIPDSLYTLLRVVTLIIFAILVSRSLFTDKKKWRRIVLNLVIAVSTCIIGISIVFRLLQFETWLYGTLRHPGFLLDPIIINPNHAAGYFGISGILSLLLLAKKEHKRKKIFYGSLFFLHSLAVFGTLSRGGILAYIVAVVFFLIISRHSFIKSRKELAIFLLPLILILASVFYAGNTLLKKEFDYEREGFFEKGVNYQNVLEYSKDFFLTGSGAGSFSKVYPYYQDNPEIRFVQLENEPVQFFLEYGLFAFIIFGTLIFIVLRQKRKDRRYKGYYAVLLFVALQNTVDFNLHNFSTLFPVLIIMLLSTDHIKVTGIKAKIYASIVLTLSIAALLTSTTPFGQKLVGYEKAEDYAEKVYQYPAHYLIPMEKTIKKMNSGKITEVIEASQTISAVIEKAPNYYFSYYLAGSLMLRIGSNDQALEFFRHSLLKTTDRSFLKTFIKVCNTLKNYNLKEKIPLIIPEEDKQREKIETYIFKESGNNKALESYILQNKNKFPLGAVKIYIRNKDFIAAENLIKNISKKDISIEKQGEFHIFSGMIHKNRSEYREAFSNFLIGARITDHFRHFMLAANCALKLEDKEIKLAENLLKKHILNSSSNLTLYYLWKHKKNVIQRDVPMALRSLEKAAKLSSAPHIARKLAVYYYKNGLYTQARSQVKIIIRNHPDYHKNAMKNFLEKIEKSISRKEKDTIKDSLLNQRL